MSRTSAGRAITAACVIVAVALAAPAAGATAPASMAAGAATTTGGSCAAYVTIAGKRTCLAVGKSCKRTYERKYNSKGFTCKRNAAGSYRLRRLKQSF